MLILPTAPYMQADAAVYTANAVDINGAYMSRGATLTSISNSSVGIVSCWVNWNTLAGLDFFYTDAQVDPSKQFTINFTTAEDWRLQVDGGADRIDYTSDSFTGVTSAGNWVNVLCAWDVNAAAGARTVQVYLNDTDMADAYNADTGSAFSFPHTSATDFHIFHNGIGLFPPDALVSEVYINTDATIDISVEANRRKFRDASGKPVSLGSDGSTPTGSQPVIYLNGDYTNFEVNAGYGGDFTVTGTFAAAASSPSD